MLVTSTTIPPLENGDRLSRREFERRYQAMPHLKHAELIEGKVHMASPLRIRAHGEPHGNLIGWLWTYKTATPGLVLGDNATVRLDLDNELQPDAVLFVPGRGAIIDAEDYIAGAPELIVEVAASSISIDLHEKKQAYRRNAVREYLVWRVFDCQVDWFCLDRDEYLVLAPDAAGVACSRIFPGLWLHVEALLAGDMALVLATVQAGLRSAEHGTFVRDLG